MCTYKWRRNRSCSKSNHDILESREERLPIRCWLAPLVLRADLEFALWWCGILWKYDTSSPQHPYGEVLRVISCAGYDFRDCVYKYHAEGYQIRDGQFLYVRFTHLVCSPWLFVPFHKVTLDLKFGITVLEAIVRRSEFWRYDPAKHGRSCFECSRPRPIAFFPFRWLLHRPSWQPHESQSESRLLLYVLHQQAKIVARGTCPETRRRPHSKELVDLFQRQRHSRSFYRIFDISSPSPERRHAHRNSKTSVQQCVHPRQLSTAK